MSSPFISQKDGTVRVAAALAAVPLFSGLGHAAIAELAAHFVQRHLNDGAYLFRADEPADRLFVLADGTLEVVGAAGILNTLAPAALVGELAVLRGATRSASVRARGEAIVLSMDARDFLERARRWPDLALALARAAANGFVGAERRALEQGTPVWAVVLDGAMDVDFAVVLARAALRHRKGLGQGKRVTVLAPVSAASFEDKGLRVEIQPLLFASAKEVSGLVHAARRDAALVLVAALPAALEEVLYDCTGAVTAGSSMRVPERLRRVELCADGAPAANRVIGPPRVPLDEAAGRVARILMRRSVGIALGGGAARALCQLGVLEVMGALGVPIDFLAGTSMGAAVGGIALANGVPRAVELLRRLDTPVKVLHRFVDQGWGDGGRFEGRRLVRALERELVTKDIEMLPIPFASVALNLETGEEEIIAAGPLAQALRASGLVPGMLAPWTYQPPGAARPGRYVDGGVIDLVPVDALRALGADLTIGVHVVHLRDFAMIEEKVTGDPATRVLLAQLLALARVGEKQTNGADLSILPDAGAIGLTELWRGPELVEIGRQAARQAESALREMM